MSKKNSREEKQRRRWEREGLCPCCGKKMHNVTVTGEELRRMRREKAPVG